MSFWTASNHAALTARNARAKAAARFAGSGLEQSSLLQVLVWGGCTPVNPPSSCFQACSSFLFEACLAAWPKPPDFVGEAFPARIRLQPLQDKGVQLPAHHGEGATLGADGSQVHLCLRLVPVRQGARCPDRTPLGRLHLQEVFQHTPQVDVRHAPEVPARAGGAQGRLQLAQLRPVGLVEQKFL